MCHQTIEKVIKAYFVQHKDETAPFSHSLSYLAKRAGIYIELTDDHKYFIDEIEPLNIEARYPSHKNWLLEGLTKEKCIEMLNKTKELQQWIKARL